MTRLSEHQLTLAAGCLNDLGIFAYCGAKVLYCFNGNHFEDTTEPLIKAALNMFPRDSVTRIVNMHRQIYSCIKTKFDSDPRLIAFTNCVYSLKTRTFRPGKIRDYITKTTGYPYVKPEITQITYAMQFFSKVLSECQLDANLKKISKILLPGNFVMFLGDQCTGKTTVLSIIHRCLGDYANRQRENDFQNQKDVTRISIVTVECEPIISCSWVRHLTDTGSILMTLEHPIVVDNLKSLKNVYVVPFVSKQIVCSKVECPDLSTIFRILVYYIEY